MKVNTLFPELHRRYKDHKDVGQGRNKLSGYHYSQNETDTRRDRPGWEDSLLLARDFSDLLFHWGST